MLKLDHGMKCSRELIPPVITQNLWYCSQIIDLVHTWFGDSQARLRSFLAMFNIKTSKKSQTF